MRYYKIVRNNRLVSIGKGVGGAEITEEEYKTLLFEITAKTALVDKLYGGEITAAEVPPQWRREVQRRVNERIEAEKLLELETTPPNEEAGGDVR